MWQLGAAYAVPAGLGIVEGDDPVQAGGAGKEDARTSRSGWSSIRRCNCYLPGVPRAMYMPYPFQIIQSQKHIMIIHEFAGAVRTIYMADQIEAPADSWMGWSNGKWEGETLVVDTKGFNGMAWFDRAGNFASDGLHVVERFTRAQPGDAELRSDDRRSRTCSPSRGRSACRSIGAWSATRRSRSSGAWSSRRTRLRPPGQATTQVEPVIGIRYQESDFWAWAFGIDFERAFVMSTRFRVSAGILAAAIAVAAYLAQPTSRGSSRHRGRPHAGATAKPQPAAPTNTAKPAASTYKAARTPDGQPDLQGFWTNATLTPLRAAERRHDGVRVERGVREASRATRGHRRGADEAGHCGRRALRLHAVRVGQDAVEDCAQLPHVANHRSA